MQPWDRLDDAELDRQYNARASVPSYDAEHAKYVAASDRVRAEFPRLTLRYDSDSGQTLDFYPAAAADAPLFVWIHGGYWRAGSSADNAFAVRGPLAQGFAVAVIDYALAPAAGIDEIIRQVRAAIAALHRDRDRLGIAPGPFAVGGSSAGGHLVGMLLADGWQAPLGLPADIVGTGLALSGLHWIAPLKRTQINGWMGFDDGQIARNSPALQIPARTAAHLIAAAGGRETDEFRRQTADYAAAWQAAGHAATVVPMPHHNHFDIALTLSEPDGALVRTLVATHRSVR